MFLQITSSMTNTEAALGQPAMTQLLAKLQDKSEDEKKVRKIINVYVINIVTIFKLTIKNQLFIVY